MCYLQETHLRTRNTYRLKVREWKKIFHANGNQKKLGVIILITDKIDLKIKIVTRDKERHYIMIKGSIQEEGVTNINIFTQHRSTSIHKQMLTSMKGEIKSNTIIVGDINTLLTQMDRSFRQKINKKTQSSYDTWIR